jgi:hypothetical protein
MEANVSKDATKLFVFLLLSCACTVAWTWGHGVWVRDTWGGADGV